MVSINPNFQGRVAGKPRVKVSPQKEDSQPQVQTQQLQTQVQPQQLSIDNDSLLAFKGIQIHKPEIPEKVDDGANLEGAYFPDTPEEYNKIVKSGILKEGDDIRDPSSGRWGVVCKDQNGNLYIDYEEEKVLLTSK